MNFTLDMKVGDNKSVDVKTTSNRGFTPQEIAKRCSDRLVSVSDTASPLIRDQARAYKNQMEQVIAHYMQEAIKSDRTTLYNLLKSQGHGDVAEIIRRL
jgi:major membrane immunogen (membrane-anchored lipoprotein)